MTIRAKLNGVAECLHLSDLTLHGLKFLALMRVHCVRIRRQIRHISVFHIDKAIRLACQGHCVGGRKHFTITQTQHQRRALSSHHHTMRIFLTENSDGISSSDAIKSIFNGFEQIALVAITHQKSQDFRVRLACELNSLGL